MDSLRNSSKAPAKATNSGRSLKLGKNANQVAEIVNGAYGPDTVIAQCAQFRFRRFRSGIPVVENVDKITETIEVDRHASSCNIAQEPKIDYKTVLNYLYKDGFKKKFEVWMLHQLTQKT
ncbi:histone-lysine N-methyltransferase SETMAR [Trichonephila clavipes]|nr:histone-lysine N-methyltransferase SETMAR [Trichonephila clavipes]